MKRYKLIVAVLSVLFFSSCTKDSCELTADDMDWLLEEYDSLYYLKNGTDTVVAKVISGFGQSEYDWQYGIRTGDNNYYGYSNIIFNINDNDTIFFRYSIHACEDNILIISVNKDSNNKYIGGNNYHTLKNSVTNFNYYVAGVEYTNCIYFSSTQDKIIREFIFVKGYGVIKFQTHQNELFELLPLNLKE